MCGIYGILEKTSGFDDYSWSLLQQMATLTELRGKHSSGVFSVNKDKNTTNILKVLGPSGNLMWERGWQKWFHNSKHSPAVIGHGRYATVGKITLKNAHPFRDGTITMVHNGTLRDGVDIVKAGVDVDSHALTKLIATKGIKEAFSQVEGAWAIVAHDSTTGYIHILRNAERDLHYLETYLGYFIMSERDGLEYIAKRNRLTGEIKPFETDLLYTFDPRTKQLTIGDHTPGKYVCPTFHYGFRECHNFSDCRTPEEKPRQQTAPALPKSKEEELVYKVGDLATFEVVAIREMGSKNYTFVAEDELGNHICFTTHNVKQAQLVQVGDQGMAEVYGFSCSPSHKTTYFVRFREITWQDNIEVLSDSKLLHTYGGETISETDWASLVQSECCESCLGILDFRDVENTVIVKKSNSYRVFCSHCVDAYCKDQKSVGSSKDTAIQHLRSIQ